MTESSETEVQQQQQSPPQAEPAAIVKDSVDQSGKDQVSPSDADVNADLATREGAENEAADSPTEADAAEEGADSSEQAQGAACLDDSTSGPSDEAADAASGNTSGGGGGGSGYRPPGAKFERKPFRSFGNQAHMGRGGGGIGGSWRESGYDGGFYGKQQQQQQQQLYGRPFGANGYGSGGRYNRVNPQSSGPVYGYPGPGGPYQNGQSGAAGYYNQPGRAGGGVNHHQAASAAAAAAAAAAAGDPQSNSNDMLILQQQSYVPQDQSGNGGLDRSGHHHPGLVPHAGGGHMGPSPGRSQYHPNVPQKAILYGSYVDPNMIQPSGSSRNTSPGNGENDRKSNTNLYIRGLQPSDTDETIRQLVSENANIPSDAINSTKAVLDEQTGQCKGYGFVDFRDETQAQLALDALTKTSLRNGKLQISYARESEKDPTNIYIKNLPTRAECNEEWMSRVFTEELGSSLTGRIISCRVMRATDPSTRQQTSATGAGFIRFEKDQDAVSAISHINKNGASLGQKHGCPRPLEAKLADKTNQRKKQRAQQQQQPGLAAHHGLGPSPPGAAGQLPLSIFQQNSAALAAARGAAAAAAAAVLPGSYGAQMLPSGATAQLYSPAAVQSNALTSYTSRVTPAAPPSAPAHTSYVFQASPASAMTGGAGAGASIYQQRSSWLIDPSSYAAAAAAGMQGMSAAGMYAPQLLAAAPQTSLYAAPDAAPLYYATAGLDPTASAYHPMGLTASAEPQ